MTTDEALEALKRAAVEYEIADDLLGADLDACEGVLTDRVWAERRCRADLCQMAIAYARAKKETA